MQTQEGLVSDGWNAGCPGRSQEAGTDLGVVFYEGEPIEKIQKSAGKVTGSQLALVVHLPVTPSFRMPIACACMKSCLSPPIAHDS